MKGCLGRLAAAVLAVGCMTLSPAYAQVGPPGDNADGGLFGSSGMEEKLVAVAAEFTPPVPGQATGLFVTATIQPGWHIYSITQPAGGPVATRIKLTSSPAFRLLGDFRALTPPEKRSEPAFDNLTVESHKGTASWSVPIELAPGVDPATLKISGRLIAQLCDPNTCFPPHEFPFTATMGAAVVLPPPPMSTAATAAGLDYGKLAAELGFAFLGGLILNLMPCVLPVISLKILSFLEQAGESRQRIFALNAWYSLGLLSVFLVLAALAATAGLAWGEQFTLPWFKVLMTGVVFTMALSFLGVWEIPIPGFVGRGHAGQLQSQEGASGAFFKGVFTTILATPCSGPFLGPVFAYLLTQPAFVAYLVFGSVGLGMASPYLLLGAFPHLMRFLPRPGAWMETVQQLMGFLLLATVVYLFTTLSSAYFIPMLALLMALWFACWWIGRTPLTASVQARLLAYSGSLLTTALVGVFAFTVLMHEPKISWQPFSPEVLQKARADGKTVMVDFSANWCPTCKLNLKLAVDTRNVKKWVEDNQVVPLLADWSDRSPTIKQALNDLGYQSIPLLAIWPAGAENGGVIVLTDLLTESTVLDALKKAGPSRMKTAASATAATAMGATP